MMQARDAHAGMFRQLVAAAAHMPPLCHLRVQPGQMSTQPRAGL